MQNFQKITLITLSIILFIALTFVGIILFIIFNFHRRWPPNITQCPDYWTFKKDGNGNKCVNESNINTCKHNWPEKFKTGTGYCTNNYIDLSKKKDSNNVYYNKLLHITKGSTRNEDLNCAKFKWAKYEGLQWDGITNNRSICRDSKI